MWKIVLLLCLHEFTPKHKLTRMIYFFWIASLKVKIPTKINTYNLSRYIMYIITFIVLYKCKYKYNQLHIKAKVNRLHWYIFVVFFFQWYTNINSQLKPIQWHHQCLELELRSLFLERNIFVVLYTHNKKHMVSYDCCCIPTNAWYQTDYKLERINFLALHFTR